jgi:hypothetical protein
MEKTIIIDAKLYNSQSQEFSRTNILLAGRKILGLGYIPDDDDIQADTINVNGSFIIPSLSNCYPIKESDKNIANKSGFTNTLDYKELLCDKTGSDLAYTLQMATRTQSPLYCILQNLSEDLSIYMEAKKNNSTLAAGVPLNILEKEDLAILEALTKNGTIQTIVCGHSPYETFIENALAYLSPSFDMPDILKLLSFNPFYVAGRKVPDICLLSSPNLCIIDPKKSPVLQCVLVQGEPVVDNTK